MGLSTGCCQVSLQMCSEQIAFATGLLFWNGETRQRDAIQNVLFVFVLAFNTQEIEISTYIIVQSGGTQIVPTQLSWAVVISHLLLMTKSQQGDANRTSQQRVRKEGV